MTTPSLKAAILEAVDKHAVRELHEDTRYISFSDLASVLRDQASYDRVSDEVWNLVGEGLLRYSSGKGIHRVKSEPSLLDIPSPYAVKDSDLTKSMDVDGWSEEDVEDAKRLLRREIPPESEDRNTPDKEDS